MKKIIYYLTFYLLILSCASNEYINVNYRNEHCSTFVSKEEAINEVTSLLENLQIKTKTSMREIDLDNVYSTGETINTRGDISSNISPLVYIINFKNEQGYAIVSGDKRTQPIFALMDSGTLKEGDVLTNPGAIMMLSLAEADYLKMINSQEDQLFFIDQQDIRTKVPEHDLWNDFTTWGHILECEWGQDTTPYNLYTFTSDGKQAVTGCASVAVAQILYYWGVDFTVDGTRLEWEKMRRQISHNSIMYPPAYEMIGKLFSELGSNENLNTKYGVDKSSSSPDNFVRTFKNCGLQDGGKMEAYNYDLITEAIKKGPILLTGYSKKITTKKQILGITISTTTSYEGGHAWVIDQLLTRHRTKYAYSNGEVHPVEQYEHLVHCNMGWHGSSNGYYFSGKFDTNKGGYITDITKDFTKTSSEGENNFYQFNLQMNIGINNPIRYE